MSFGLNEPAFWDEANLEKELHRVAEICDGCRLCFNLCPSFGELLGRIDNAGDCAKLGREDFRVVEDLCYQCKLCYVKCPYTPPHEFDLDFPRLLLRAKAVRVRRDGLSVQERFLGNTDLSGRVGSALAPLSNWANRNGICRDLLERSVGIHHNRVLPTYRKRTFASWFKKRAVTKEPGRNGRVALFYTCSVNYNEPDVGEAAVLVLQHNGVDVACPEQRCCGMPYLDTGDIASAKRSAAINSGHMAQAVEAGYEIVVLGPTCTYMLKQEYPHLVPELSQRLAGHVFDVFEYLARLHRAGKLNTTFRRGLGKVAYHVPCHLKALNVGYKARDLLQLIPGTTVQTIERCCGVDGTWGMRKQYHDLSLKVGSPLFDAVRKAAADFTASDCLLAGMQIRQGSGIAATHPLIMLRDAYGL